MLNDYPHILVGLSELTQQKISFASSKEDVDITVR
jgi:hypothetical protein